jgi:hypothetical protein
MDKPIAVKPHEAQTVFEQKKQVYANHSSGFLTEKKSAYHDMEQQRQYEQRLAEVSSRGASIEKPSREPNPKDTQKLWEVRANLLLLLMNNKLKPNNPYCDYSTMGSKTMINQ